jgi:hypothetical protein
LPLREEYYGFLCSVELESDSVIFVFMILRCEKEAMSYLARRQRLKIALGGFLFFIGLVVLIFTFLVATKWIDVENFLQSDFSPMLGGLVVVIGSLDIVAGILLLRTR